MLSKLRRGECNDFWKEIKVLNSGESNIANLWKDHFSAMANSVGYTDNQDKVMNALGSVPGHNDVINVHELRQIVSGLKIKKAVCNDGIP